MESEFVVKLIIASFTMPLILSGILIWFVITYQKKKNEYEISKRDQKLREQELIIQRQQALTAERTRIASEMHDDLGGGLTTIKFLSQKALRKIEDPNQKTQIQKIVNNAQTLVGNMSEIIWAMNAGFDTVDNLVAYCRRYAREYLDDHEIKLNFTVDGNMDHHTISGEERRNIFLVVKEALHNTVKHAEATTVNISFDIKDDVLHLIIADNGKGLHDKHAQFGNGLDNMKNRIEDIKGELKYITNEGLTIDIQVPIARDNIES